MAEEERSEETLRKLAQADDVLQEAAASLVSAKKQHAELCQRIALLEEIVFEHAMDLPESLRVVRK